jgi:MoaA/NifB/PqqE/SkfB family radical SAM enzyme
MVDELRGSLMLMLFWDWGEPLLHPRLADMIAHATRSRIRTIVSTNGTVANSSPELEALTRAGLDLIIVCVDGATQSTYETYRIGGQLTDALATVERVAEARRRIGFATPAIEFRTLATRHNEAEMPELLRLAEQTGADFLTLKSLRPYDYRGHDVDNELVPFSEDLARFAYRDGRGALERVHPSEPGPLMCGKPVYAPTLNSDGELVFCSYARHQDERFGPIAAGFKRVWRSAEGRRKRVHYLEAEGTRSCETCYFRSDHKPTILYTVPLRPMPPGISLQFETSREEFPAAGDVVS